MGTEGTPKNKVQRGGLIKAILFTVFIVGVCRVVNRDQTADLQAYHDKMMELNTTEISITKLEMEEELIMTQMYITIYQTIAASGTLENLDDLEREARDWSVLYEGSNASDDEVDGIVFRVMNNHNHLNWNRLTDLRVRLEKIRDDMAELKNNYNDILYDLRMMK